VRGDANPGGRGSCRASIQDWLSRSFALPYGIAPHVLSFRPPQLARASLCSGRVRSYAAATGSISVPTGRTSSIGLRKSGKSRPRTLQRVHIRHRRYTLTLPLLAGASTTRRPAGPDSGRPALIPFTQRPRHTLLGGCSEIGAQSLPGRLCNMSFRLHAHCGRMESLRAPNVINSWLISVATVFLTIASCGVAVGQFDGDSSREVTNVPTSTFGGTVIETSLSSIGISGSSNGWGSDGFAGNAKNAGGANMSVNEFGDLRTTAAASEEYSTGQIVSSPGADLVQVLWLGDDFSVAGVPETTLGVTSGAAGIKAWYWQRLGMVRRAQQSAGPVALTDAGPPTAWTRSTFGTHTNGMGIIYGFREVRLADDFRVDGFGGILGHTYVDTTAESQIAGPELGVVFAKSNGPFTMKLQGTTIAGLNEGRVYQQAGIGNELIPGATNRLLYAQPTNCSHAESLQEFSPSEEFRAESNLRITDDLSFKLVGLAPLSTRC
jgi:hypothetical protein